MPGCRAWVYMEEEGEMEGTEDNVGGEMYRETSSWVLGIEVPGVTGLEMRRIGNGVSAPPGLRGHFLSI